MTKTNIQNFTGMINNDIIDHIFKSYGLSQYDFSFKVYAEDYDYQMHRENNQYIRVSAIDLCEVLTAYTMTRLSNMIPTDEYYFKADLDRTRHIIITRCR